MDIMAGNYSTIISPETRAVFNLAEAHVIICWIDEYKWPVTVMPTMLFGKNYKH